MSLASPTMTITGRIGLHRARQNRGSRFSRATPRRSPSFRVPRHTSAGMKLPTTPPRLFALSSTSKVTQSLRTISQNKSLPTKCRHRRWTRCSSSLDEIARLYTPISFPFEQSIYKLTEIILVSVNGLGSNGRALVERSLKS